MTDTHRRYALTLLSHGIAITIGLLLFPYFLGWITQAWPLLVILVLLMVAVWFSPSSYFFRRGARFFKHNDYEQAAAQFTQSHLANKKWARPLDLRAHCLAELRDYAGALADVDAVIERKPKFYEPYMVRAYVYCKMDDFQNALLDAEMAVKLKPKSAYPLNMRGIVYVNLDQYELALQDLNEALRRKPKLAATYSNRGMAHLRSGNAEAALADFEKAIRLNPNMPQAHHNRGEYHLLRRDYPSALADFQKANSLNPQSDYAIAGLALTYFLTGNRAPARNFWRLLIERDFNYADVDWAIDHLHFPAVLEPSLRELVNPS